MNFTEKDLKWLAGKGFVKIESAPGHVYYSLLSSPYKVSVFREEGYFVEIGWTDEDLFARGGGRTLKEAVSSAVRLFKEALTEIRKDAMGTVKMLGGR